MKVSFMPFFAARKTDRRRMQSKLDANSISVMQCLLQGEKYDLRQEYSGKIYRPLENAMRIFTIPGNPYCKDVFYRHESEKTV